MLTSTTQWKEMTAFEKKKRLIKAYFQNLDRWERKLNEIERRYRKSYGS